VLVGQCIFTTIADDLLYSNVFFTLSSHLVTILANLHITTSHELLPSFHSLIAHSFISSLLAACNVIYF
jgi:hypothetical protein